MGLVEEVVDGFAGVLVAIALGLELIINDLI